MPKRIQLTIQNPCSENWDQMSPVEKGRFCNSCQKPVVDFTAMSDSQVGAFFKKPSTGSVCGRFLQDQLHRDITIPKKRIPWVKHFFQFAIPAFLFSSRVAAQGTVRILSGDTVVLGEKRTNQGVAPQHSPGTIVKGRTTSEKGEAIAGVTVMIKGTNRGTTTDANGRFAIDIATMNPEVILVFSYIGYETQERKVDESMLRDEFVQVLSTAWMGEVVVVGLMIVKEVPEVPVIPVLLRDSVFNSLKLFPNPVRKGASLTIEWKQRPEEYYAVDLINLSGKFVHRREIWIDAEAKILNLNIPFVKSGAYFLKIVGKQSGKSFTEKIIIQ